jgi:exoribonuclease-2
MSSSTVRPASLVLYKSRPARVVGVTDKIDIDLGDGKAKRVRDKDVLLLHPGPCNSLGELKPLAGDLREAWELAAGEEITLADLAGLVHGEYSPASAWATWQAVAEGVYFEGEPARLVGRAAEQVAALTAEREAKARAEQDWQAFLERVDAAAIDDEDRRRLAEVERVALGRSAASRVMQALGRQETPQNAHRLLVSCGYWSPTHNPWPARESAPLVSADLPVPDLLDEDRLDLTHLPAFAIDDEGNQDPDDALSLDGDTLWVHVADVAALVARESDIDREARSRGANLYLPEGVVHMLPEALTHRLGLGLNDISPALSFGCRLGEDGGIAEVSIAPSWVRVTRVSYEAADARLAEQPFADMVAFTERYRARRQARGATGIDLPEVSVKVVDGRVVIRRLPRLGSRDLVTDAMLMAGEAAARFAIANGIAMPFATQVAPDEIRTPADMAGMYAYRRLFKPSQTKAHPEPHGGLGIEAYVRATSPLRRYQDLLAHQQLRAFLHGEPPLAREALAERYGVADAASVLVRRAERLSNQHWKLVYLRDSPGWEGDAVVVDLEERKAVLMIPDLAFETRIRLQGSMAPNQRVRLRVREVDLPEASVYFRALD